jgi:DNA-binding MarR family transcriptional regulator
MEVRMAEGREATLINDFLGSTHIFARAVAQVIEEKLWREAAGRQLTVTQMRLLKLVSHPGGVHTIGDVATFLGVSNAAASKAVDKLVRLILIRRREGESDRRAIHLSLTGPGQRMLDAYNAAAQSKLAEVFGQFGMDELQPVVQLLDRLSFNMMNGRAAATEEICVRCGIYFREKCLLRQRSAKKCLYLRGRMRAAGESEELE